MKFTRVIFRNEKTPQHKTNRSWYKHVHNWPPPQQKYPVTGLL